MQSRLYKTCRLVRRIQTQIQKNLILFWFFMPLVSKQFSCHFRTLPKPSLIMNIKFIRRKSFNFFLTCYRKKKRLCQVDCANFQSHLMIFRFLPFFNFPYLSTEIKRETIKHCCLVGFFSAIFKYSNYSSRLCHIINAGHWKHGKVHNL